MVHRDINISKTNSFFLFGARGTGKTTLMRERICTPRSVYIDLLKFSELTRLSSNPEELEQRILDDTDWVIIDEVQKVPALLDTVHYLLEDPDFKKRNIRFALSGSSARKLKAGGANLLAGRAFVYDLYPLTHLELGEKFDLYSILKWGSLPKICQLSDDNDKKVFLETYALNYLKEEIWDEHLVKDLTPFRRFLQVAAQCNGTVLNYSQVAKDVRVDTKTVQRYFQILEDTLLGVMLEPYHASLRKRQRANPKFYFFDLGVVRGLTGDFALELTEHSLGFGYLFEHFVLLELIRQNGYLRKNYDFSFLRDDKGREIDIVIERPSAPTVFIEIKSTDHIREDHVEILNYYSSVFPNSEYYCLSRDPVEQQIRNVRALHWTQAFELLGLVSA